MRITVGQIGAGVERADDASDDVPGVHGARFQGKSLNLHACTRNVAEQARAVERIVVDVETGEGVFVAVEFSVERIGAGAGGNPTLASLERGTVDGEVQVGCEFVVLALKIAVAPVHHNSEGEHVGGIFDLIRIPRSSGAAVLEQCRHYVLGHGYRRTETGEFAEFGSP